MKNSAINTVKAVAVDTVKVMVYPAHLVLQTGADLLNIGQAQAIKVIDGTPVLQSMFEQQTWTQNKQAAVVNKYMEVKERIEKQRDFNRQQDINRLKKSLDKLECVEHITENVSTPNYNTIGGEITKIITEMTHEEIEELKQTKKVPAPPKRENAVAKAIRKAEGNPIPLMTAPAI